MVRTGPARLTLARLALARLRHQWPLAAAQLLGLVAAVTLATSVPLVQSAAAEAGLRQTISGLGSAADIEIQQAGVRTPGDYDAFQAAASDRVRTVMGDRLLPGAHYSLTSKFNAVSHNGRGVTGDGGDPPQAVRIADGAERHVRLVAGVASAGAAAGTVPATVSDRLAGSLGLAPGDTYCLATPPVAGFRPPPQQPFCLTVTGIWRASDPGEPFWAGPVPNDFLLDRAHFFALIESLPGARVYAGQYYAPDPTRMAAADDQRTMGDLTRLRGEFTVGKNATFITALDGSLKSFQARLDNARLAGLLVEFALLGIALFAVAYVAGHFLDGQGQAIALWRARGWPRRRVWQLLSLQFLLLMALAVPIGLAVAVLSIRALAFSEFGSAAGAGPADLMRLAPQLAVAVAAGMLLLGWQAAAAAGRGVLQVRRESSGAARRPWYQRRNLDLGLALMGLAMLAYAHFLAGANTTSDPAGGDALTLLLPGLGIGLLAVASLRLLGLAALILGAAGGSLAGSLAAWQLERQPGQHSRLALLLSLAIAIGLFASTYAATDHRNVVDRTDYTAGGDLRAVFARSDRPPPIAAAISGLPGLVASTELFRAVGRPGNSEVDATVLGIDGPSLWNAARRDGVTGSRQLDELTQRLVTADPDGVALPGRPQQLSVWVLGSALDARLAGEFTDAQGETRTAVLGDLAYSGWRQLSAPLAGPYPLRLRTLAISATGPRQKGAIALSDLSAGTSSVEGFEQPDGWWKETAGPLVAEADLPAGGAQAHSGRPATSVDVDLAAGSLLLHPVPSPKPLPALVSEDTQRKLGIPLNQPFTLRVDSNDVRVVPVGSVRYFPTLYPGSEDFLVLPRSALLGRLTHEQSLTAWSNEAWLRVAGSPDGALSKLRQQGGPSLLEVSDRWALQAAAFRDPLRTSLNAELLIGFVAALAVAVVAFGLHFLVLTRIRVSEFAIMQANGLSWRSVNASLRVEQAVLLIYSLLVGGAMGLLLAWVVLPVLHLGSSPQDLTPPTVLQVDAPAALLAGLGVALAAALSGHVAARLGGRFRLLDQLRTLA